MWNFNENKKWANNVNGRINTKNEQKEAHCTLHTVDPNQRPMPNGSTFQLNIIIICYKRDINFCNLNVPSPLQTCHIQFMKLAFIWKLP